MWAREGCDTGGSFAPTVPRRRVRGGWIHLFRFRRRKLAKNRTRGLARREKGRGAFWFSEQLLKNHVPSRSMSCRLKAVLRTNSSEAKRELQQVRTIVAPVILFVREFQHSRRAEPVIQSKG